MGLRLHCCPHRFQTVAVRRTRGRNTAKKRADLHILYQYLAVGLRFHIFEKLKTPGKILNLSSTCCRCFLGLGRGAGGPRAAVQRSGRLGSHANGAAQGGEHRDHRYRCRRRGRGRGCLHGFTGFLCWFGARFTTCPATAGKTSVYIYTCITSQRFLRNLVTHCNLSPPLSSLVSLAYWYMLESLGCTESVRNVHTYEHWLLLSDGFWPAVTFTVSRSPGGRLLYVRAAPPTLVLPVHRCDIPTYTSGSESSVCQPSTPLAGLPLLSKQMVWQAIGGFVLLVQ